MKTKLNLKELSKIRGGVVHGAPPGLPGDDSNMRYNCSCSGTGNNQNHATGCDCSDSGCK